MIREMRLCDIPACRDIIKDNWNEDIAARAVIEMRHAFDNSMEWPPIYYVYEIDGEAVAFAGMIPSWIMTGVYDFIWINVCKDHQGNGIGHALTQHRIREVDKRDGSAIHLMTQKYRFFASHGFHIAASYGTKEPWLLMVKQMGKVALI